MTNLEMIEFIDEFLSEQEDVLHGIEGKDCTKSRKYLDMIKKQLSIHGVVKSLPTETTISIDKSIMLLEKALENIVFFDGDEKIDFILDIVKEYKKQLK